MDLRVDIVRSSEIKWGLRFTFTEGSVLSSIILDESDSEPVLDIMKKGFDELAGKNSEIPEDEDEASKYWAQFEEKKV
jgi:hypothetical protein